MFFDRPEKGLKTLLLIVRIGKSAYHEHDVEELRELADSAGLSVEFTESVARHAAHPATCIGRGKLQDLADTIRSKNLDLLLLDHELTATQQRNLEVELNVRVLTRTELILHIFDGRARTYEGKLQVELAMLSHAQSHLVRGWTHLDRQRGGVNLRGVGEKQLAIDKYLLQQRISTTRSRLEKVQRRRTQQRRKRMRSRIPTVALVGYTNTGKSTLFNALTRSMVYADDRLFATLDPTVRQLDLAGRYQVLLADTVGFIKDLPMDLVAAFKATLEEATNADLLVHVMDASAANLDEVQSSVEKVLAEIGAESIPKIAVYNKTDLTNECTGIRQRAAYVSAKHSDGLDELQELVLRKLQGLPRKYCVELEPTEGKIRSVLYQMHAVEAESYSEDGRALLTVSLAREQVQELKSRHGFCLHAPQTQSTI